MNYQIQLSHILQHSSRNWSVPLATLLKNRVYPFFFTPHTSHVGQPADHGPNSSLKSFFTIEYNKWKRQAKQRGVYTRQVFNLVLGRAWHAMREKCDDDLHGRKKQGRRSKYKKGTNVITSAWKKCGLVPFNPFSENWEKGIKQLSVIQNGASASNPHLANDATKITPLRTNRDSDAPKLHVTVQVNMTTADENDPTLPAKIRKLIQNVAISSDCRQSLLELHEINEDEETTSAKEMVKRTAGSSFISPFKLGQSFSVDESIELLKRIEKEREEKKTADEEEKKRRDQAKKDSERTKMQELEALLFKSTEMLNDYTSNKISDLKKSARGGVGFSKDAYISLLCAVPRDTMRIDRDKYDIFKGLKLTVAKKMFWEKRCGVKDSDVKLDGSSIVVWCMDDGNFYKGKVENRKTLNGQVLYEVKYTDNDREDLSLLELQRKLHIEYTAEDIPRSEASA